MADDVGVMRWIGALALGLVSGCTPEVTPEMVAQQRFEEFQDALFQRDRSALHKLVCNDARRAIPGLCKASLSGRKRLVVTGVTRQAHEYRVHVEDPNRASAEEVFYVLTKEDGHMRVDLLTTMRYLGRRTGARRVSRPALVPGKLSRAQIEQAQQTARPPSR